MPEGSGAIKCGARNARNQSDSVGQRFLYKTGRPTENIGISRLRTVLGTFSVQRWVPLMKMWFLSCPNGLSSPATMRSSSHRATVPAQRPGRLSPALDLAPSWMRHSVRESMKPSMWVEPETTWAESFPQQVSVTCDHAGDFDGISLADSQETTTRSFSGIYGLHSVDCQTELDSSGLNNMYNALAVEFMCDITVPSTIPDRLESAWSTFLSRLARTHSTTSACHAATEVFVVGEEIITLLVTLREDLDFTPNFWTERNIKTDFDAQAITMTASFSSGQSPTSWLTYQASAGAVQRPRMKSALWTLGALPVQSHIPESSSFRWLKQSWLTSLTRDGPLFVMSVSSGEETSPLPRAHELRVRLTHPANDFQRFRLHASIDAEYETVIKDDCEDWIIAAGHVTCPHAQRSWPCPYQDFTFDSAAAKMWKLCLQLINSQTERTWTHATIEQRRVAREIGELHYRCRHAYGLLTYAEYNQYHSVSFASLTILRAQLDSLPAGTIWNYLEPVSKADAVCYRLNNACT
ncbi:hypothetical protein MVEN_00027600 [Mycena venus]|uniref:Uncharacterized protein n=1 Tax=Mycena venus TaxID=2733690 RepID=A0A8H7DHM2_9AGAR|nr:hypothetical protein MVEN_00027600 [Mycena venus]